MDPSARDKPPSHIASNAPIHFLDAHDTRGPLLSENARSLYPNPLTSLLSHLGMLLTAWHSLR
jgi:hypothetical protein